MNMFANYCKMCYKKKQALKSIVLLISVIIVWQPTVHVNINITILCLKVEQKQVCEQSLLSREDKALLYKHKE